MAAASDTETYVDDSISTAPTLVNDTRIIPDFPFRELLATADWNTELRDIGGHSDNARELSFRQHWALSTTGDTLTILDEFRMQASQRTGEIISPDAQPGRGLFPYGEPLLDDPLVNGSPWVAPHVTRPLLAGEETVSRLLRGVEFRGRGSSAARADVVQSRLSFLGIQEPVYFGQSRQPDSLPGRNQQGWELGLGSRHAIHGGDLMGLVPEADRILDARRNGWTPGSMPFHKHIVETLQCGFCGRIFRDCPRMRDNHLIILEHVKIALTTESIRIQDWKSPEMPGFLYFFDGDRHFQSPVR